MTIDLTQRGSRLDVHATTGQRHWGDRAIPAYPPGLRSHAGAPSNDQVAQFGAQRARSPAMEGDPPRQRAGFTTWQAQQHARLGARPASFGALDADVQAPLPQRGACAARGAWRPPPRNGPLATVRSAAPDRGNPPQRPVPTLGTDNEVTR